MDATNAATSKFVMLMKSKGIRVETSPQNSTVSLDESSATDFHPPSHSAVLENMNDMSLAGEAAAGSDHFGSEDSFACPIEESRPTSPTSVFGRLGDQNRGLLAPEPFSRFHVLTPGVTATTRTAIAPCMRTEILFCDKTPRYQAHSTSGGGLWGKGRPNSQQDAARPKNHVNANTESGSGCITNVATFSASHEKVMAWLTTL